MLVPVPFTDLTSTRRRPVIVVSNGLYNRATPDVVVVAMTSTPPLSAYAFTITSADLASGALNHPGTVRVDKIYTLAQRIIVRRFGKVNDVVLDRIRRILADLCRP